MEYLSERKLERKVDSVARRCDLRIASLYQYDHLKPLAAVVVYQCTYPVGFESSPRIW